MAITNGYCTLAELKTYLGLSGSGQDTNLESAVDSASREIDAICGRFFFQTSSDTKYFTPINPLYLDVTFLFIKFPIDYLVLFIFVYFHRFYFPFVICGLGV